MSLQSCCKVENMAMLTPYARNCSDVEQQLISLKERNAVLEAQLTRFMQVGCSTDGMPIFVETW
jgi:hypothetical protein